MKRGTILATLEKVTVRTEELDDREQLIAPVILLTEGVHHGTAGPVYYSPDILEAYVETWNGIPLPVSHPVATDGTPLSANDPKIQQQQNVGRLYGVYYDSPNRQIRGEIWIDADKANRVCPDLVSLIRTGGRLEVSTGMYFITDNTPGEWNGEQHIGTVIDMRPDHLALLLSGEGACSWADGCGVRNNTKKEKSMILFDDEELEKIEGSLKGLKSEEKKTFVTRLVDNVVRVYKWFQKNELSHDDVRDALRNALREELPDNQMVWIKDQFDKYMIYEVTEMSEGMMSGAEKLYKRDYMVSDDTGAVTLGTEIVEVREETEYVPVENAGGKEPKPAENKSVNVKEDVMDKKEVVKALIANDRTNFTDENEEWLMTLSDCQLKAMEPVEVKPVEEKPKANEKKIETNDAGDDPPKEPEKVMSVDEYIKSAPPEIASSLNQMLANDRAVKDKLVKAILDNKQNEFSEESLRLMEIDDLAKLNKIAGNAVEANYELQGGGDSPETNKENEVPDPPKAFGANSVSAERAAAAK